jgi:hypothetical protein
MNLFGHPEAPVKQSEPKILRGAILSDDELYRYILTRFWNTPPLDPLVMLGLNPSKATSTTRSRIAAAARTSARTTACAARAAT